MITLIDKINNFIKEKREAIQNEKGTDQWDAGSECGRIALLEELEKAISEAIP